MYTPPAFTAPVEDAWAMMEAHPFATLVSLSAEGPHVSHVPLLLSTDRQSLTGHFARANPHHEQLEEATSNIAIFHGPHHYVSPGWYAAPEQVPTWNYAVVHVEATATLIEAPDDIIPLLTELSDHHEAGFPAPWTMDKLPPDKQQALARAVVGFRLHINTLSAKAKLSQNKPAEQDNVIAGLRSVNSPSVSHALAALMSATRT